MGEELSMENVLSPVDIDNLFSDDAEEISVKDTSTKEESAVEEQQENKETKTTENVNPESLFEDEDSESVGSEEDNKVEESPTSNKEGTSPNNVYSSIAQAFEDDGVFPDLTKEDIDSITDAKTFREAIDKQIQAQLDERQKRIDEALSVGVQPTQIQQYENTLNFIDSISEESLTDESAEGEKLRKNLIYQDFINRGYSKERAEREIKKSFDAGTDIDDAKEALVSNRDFFKEQYDALIKGQKDKVKQEEEERNRQADALKKSIVEDSKVFGDLEVDKKTRLKIYDNLMKPVYKDPKSGQYMTAIQKYQEEHREEFLRNISLIYTLTDGFKNLEGLTKGRVKKEIKKGIASLEAKLNNTSRNSDGSLNFINGNDTESFLSTYRLDI